jgi:DNA-binding response OmpR family regulator
MKLLVIEDEKDLSDSICTYLGKEQFICETAYDFREAMEKVHLNEYACIILDIMLPYGSGIDLLQKLKEENKTEGIVIISAKNSLEDKVQGLHLGADDYLAKPFHLAELSARVAAIIRRKSFDGKTRIMIDDLQLDLSDKTLKTVSGKTISLTRKEYDLLVYLVSNKNRVVTKEAMWSTYGATGLIWRTAMILYTLT